MAERCEEGRAALQAGFSLFEAGAGLKCAGAHLRQVAQHNDGAAFMGLRHEGNLAAILQGDFPMRAPIGRLQQARLGLVLQEIGKQPPCLHAIETQQVSAQGADPAKFGRIDQQKAGFGGNAGIRTDKGDRLDRRVGPCGRLFPGLQERPGQETCHHQSRKGKQHGRQLIPGCGIGRWQQAKAHHHGGRHKGKRAENRGFCGHAGLAEIHCRQGRNGKQDRQGRQGGPGGRNAQHGQQCPSDHEKRPGQIIRAQFRVQQRGPDYAGKRGQHQTRQQGRIRRPAQGGRQGQNGCQDQPDYMNEL